MPEPAIVATVKIVFEVIVPAIAVVVAAALGVAGQWWRRTEETDRRVALQELELIDRLRAVGLHDSAERVAQTVDGRTRMWTYAGEAWYRFGFEPGWRFVRVAAALGLGGLALVFVALVFLGENPTTWDTTALGRTGRTIIIVAVDAAFVAVVVFGLMALGAFLVGRKRRSVGSMLPPAPGPVEVQTSTPRPGPRSTRSASRRAR